MNGDGRESDGRENDTRRGLKLPERFRTLRISESEYKLVSLYESMRVRLGPDTGGLLDVVLSRLSVGCDEDELFRVVGTTRRELLIRVLGDLASRGMLLEGSSLEHEASSQARFFSNFRPALDAPPKPGTIAPFDNARAAQDCLRNARVLVMGLGRIGSRLACGLASVGVGQIHGADARPVGIEDLVDSAYSRNDLESPRKTAIARGVEAAGRGASRYTAVAGDPVFDGAGLPEVDLVVLCEDEFDPERHRGLNRLALEHGVTWTSCRNLGHRIEIGPTIVPRESACWHCLELRRKGNGVHHDEFDEARLALSRNGNSLGSLNVTLGYELLALEVVKIVSRFCRPMTWSAVYTFDIVSFEGRLHSVLKIPRCAACSPVMERPAFGIWNPGELFKEL